MQIKTYIPLIGMLLLSLKLFSQVAPKAKDISPLLIGEQIPELMITSADGKANKLYDLVKEKPTIMVFYRGGWCPFCNIQLGEMNNILGDIADLGFQIVAIGADAPEKLRKTIDEGDLEYKLYSDADTKISQAFGIAFEAADRKKEQLKEFSNGSNPGNLPVPSVFVIDQEGIIQFEYINPDYKTRLKSEMLLAVLKVLSSQ